MKKKIIIRKAIAGLLLLVFVFSATPQVILHNVFADHTDTISCTHGPVTSDCIHSKGINCHLNDLVVTVPYLFISCQVSSVVQLEHPVYYSAYQTHFTEDLLSSKAGRGPPFC